MASVFLGPMPPLEFLKFLAPAKKSPPKVAANHFQVMSDCKLEKDMYKPFIDLVAKFHPKFKIVDTSNSSNAAIGDDWRIKPDPTMYHHDVPTDDGNLTQFDKMELHLEFKLRVSADPFKDPPADLKDRSGWAFESSSAEGSDSRAQLIHYATEWCSRQHRVFAFSLFIAGTCMRFIRWDRAGAIASELFDFHQQPDLLVEFLWRFSHLDHAGRGFDPTVRLASPAEAILAREALAAWDPNTETPVVVFTIPGESTDEDGNTPMREFMAWASMSYPDGLIGRCTRAYPVYEKATRKLFFVKDSWRAWDLEEEAKILFELNEHEVKFIPPFTCGGDIDRERNATMTDLFIPMEDLDSDSDEPLADRSRDSTHPQDDHADEPNLKLLPPRRDSPWKCGDNWERITRRIHHRFAVAFIGQHLESFKNSRHLTQVASHTFTAHRQAYERCGYIHRDISSRNVMIDGKGNGILNDWDLAKKERQLKKARRHERTGTWQFMSSLLLLKHHEVHTIQDDMESFVLLLLYYGLRYLQHTGAFGSSLSIIEHIFDFEGKDENGGTIGGKTKETMFTKANYLGAKFRFHSRPFNAFNREAFKAIREWIEAVTLEDQLEASDDIFFEDAPKASPTPTHIPPTTSNLALSNHAAMAKLFERVLSSDGWPTEDAPDDSKFQEERRLRNEGKRGATRKRAREKENSDSPLKKKSRSSNNSGSLLPRSTHRLYTRQSARLSDVEVGEGSVRRSAPT